MNIREEVKAKAAFDQLTFGDVLGKQASFVYDLIGITGVK